MSKVKLAYQTLDLDEFSTRLLSVQDGAGDELAAAQRLPDVLGMPLPYLFVRVHASRGAGAAGSEHDDWSIGVNLSWNGLHDSELCVSVHLYGQRGDERLPLGAVAVRGDTRQWPGREIGAVGVARAAALRRAAGDGFRVLAAVAMLPGRPLGADDTFVFEGPKGAFPLGALRDGPFADAVVRAGRAEFPVHRVVLAAASPAFRSMLAGSGMREERDAAVDLPAASAGAVERLLAHCYGEDIEVSLGSLVEQYALADQYAIRSDLAWQLALALSTARVEPAALCALLPAAHAACGTACEASLYGQAAGALAEVRKDAAGFAAWPAGCVAVVLQHAPVREAFAAAAAWMAAQPPSPGLRERCWPKLLGAIRWHEASTAELREVWQCGGGGSSGFGPPGLSDRLVDVLLRLCEHAEGAAATQRAAAAAQELTVRALEDRVALLEGRILEWQAFAGRA